MGLLSNIIGLVLSIPIAILLIYFWIFIFKLISKLFK